MEGLELENGRETLGAAELVRDNVSGDFSC